MTMSIDFDPNLLRRLAARRRRDSS